MSSEDSEVHDTAIVSHEVELVLGRKRRDIGWFGALSAV
jgi:hypothetical protein